MTTPAVRIRAALRRWLWLVVACAAAGVLISVVAAQLSTPRYEATAGVLLSDRDIGSIVTAATTPDENLQRRSATDQAIAQAPGFYQRVATRLRDPVGSWRNIRSALVAAPERGTNVLSFTAHTSSAGRSTAIVNAAAAEFPRWRADVVGGPLHQARVQLEGQLAREHSPDPDLEASVSRLRVLEQTTATGAGVADRATGAKKTRPAPLRDAAVGLSSGLVLGLLLMAIFEALNPRLITETDVEDALGVPIVGSSSRASRREVAERAGLPSDVAFDRLALYLANRGRSRRGGTIVGFVSSRDGEGRTTVAAGVAGALARGGDTVVGADIGPGSGGLARALARAGEAIQSPAGSGPSERGGNGSGRTGTLAPVRTVAGNGSIAGFSARPFDPRDEATDDALGQLRSAYDWVLVEFPPVQDSAAVDTLSRHCDELIVIVRPDRASRRDVLTFARRSAGWLKRPTAAFVNAIPD